MDAGRTFHGFDLFGTIPPPSERDPAEAHERYARIREGQARGLGRGDEYYGYVDDLLARVEREFARHGVAPARACSRTRCSSRGPSRSRTSTRTGTTRWRAAWSGSGRG